jgi:hypothetical protein
MSVRDKRSLELFNTQQIGRACLDMVIAVLVLSIVAQGPPGIAHPACRGRGRRTRVRLRLKTDFATLLKSRPRHEQRVRTNYTRCSRVRDRFVVARHCGR